MGGVERKPLVPTEPKIQLITLLLVAGLEELDGQVGEQFFDFAV